MPDRLAGTASLRRDGVEKIESDVVSVGELHRVVPR
jgi:hypothetical protein